MPSTDPNPNRNYMVIVYIATIDSTEFPSSIDADNIYIIHKNEVTSSFLKIDEYFQDTFRIVKNANVTPRWGYNIYTDVVVSISYENKKYLLRASHQFIGTVW